MEEEKAVLAEIFEGAGWQTPEILKALEVADDFYLERPGVVKLDSWSEGRVVLVGDAAYCPTANTSMGTTSSLVGAYILAGEIASCCEESFSTETIQNTAAKDGAEGYQMQYEALLDILKNIEYKENA